ncbi:MAG: apolipoprotein N-acyltransferase [Verrucomicrobia bacterium]|nr:apolipoprotein N-acyltransferase [Verrucomicrobiota bacterium]
MSWARSPKAALIYPVALGLMWGAAFPKWGMAGLAWVVPGGLMLLGVLWPGSSFRLGYLCGFVTFLFSLSWLLCIPFPAGAAAGWVGLSAYLALYPAVWAWFCQRLLRGWSGPGRRGPAEGGVEAPSAWEQLLEGSWARRSLWALVIAAGWVAWEMAVGRMLSGFPWLPLGVTQYRLVPLVQVASVTGVYGVSFLVAWFSVSLAMAAWLLARKPEDRLSWLPELGLPLTAVLLVIMTGYGRIGRMEPVRGTLSVALVQPSIPQELIWDEREDEHRFEQLMELSRSALATRPQLLVWPEAALPAFTRANYDAITNLIAEHKVWMVFGADDAEARRTAAGEEEYDSFNAAFLFGPDGAYRTSYRKQRLVIFGEYVPWADWLPFLKHLTPITGSFKSGTGPVPFRLTEPEVDLGVLICFEDVFPHGAREHVRDRTDFLLNLTNNGWFGESAAQWQHAANAVFRAVENGVPLVRCTNNGLTCWIDAAGRMRQVFRDERSSEYGRGYLLVQLPVRRRDEGEVGSFYRRHGDLFGWGCVVVAVAGGLRGLRRGRQWSGTDV